MAAYGRYVKTDIARFYPSVYTHSIPWALLGKAWVKSNLASPALKSSFASDLDKAVAAGQSGQTVGIPIGPDTSRVISEIIATEVEKLVLKRLPDLGRRAVRYVDDMIIGFTETESAETVLSPISSALYEYELELSGNNTNVHGVGYPHPQEWLQYVRTFRITSRKDRQIEEIDSFFTQSNFLQGRNEDENVLLFAIRRASSFDIHDDNWFHFVRWLLYCCRRSSACLSFVVEHLSDLYLSGRRLPFAEIVDFILERLPSHAAAAHTAEVAWLLFWARELGIALPRESLREVVELRSSVCALITLDLRQRGQITGRPNLAFWNSFLNSGGLQSEMWLFAYEVAIKGWARPSGGENYIKNHQFFGDLATRKVEFYEPARRARPRVGPSFFRMLAQVRGTGASDYN